MESSRNGSATRDRMRSLVYASTVSACCAWISLASLVGLMAILNGLDDVDSVEGFVLRFFVGIAILGGLSSMLALASVIAAIAFVVPLAIRRGQSDGPARLAVAHNIVALLTLILVGRIFSA